MSNSSAMMLQVAIRCKPFTSSDKLGILLRQTGKKNAEIETINTDRTVRLPFSYAWWSAYGYKERIQEPIPEELQKIDLVSQAKAYESIGPNMLKELTEGHAIVLFAYGLSGSGKTYTVFGIDDIYHPNAWFKFDSPQDEWGIFPRLAYDLYTERGGEKGMKFSIKYFQNVHDTVRDLLSKAAVEKNFKEGMKTDKDGFMDISWCHRANVPNWSALRKAIGIANRRKCISPTQFNHCSTRGHCVLEFEVENTNLGFRGRLYLCDLAGAEPASDIHYAKYTKVQEGGSIHYEYKGRHPDHHKSTELQEQGKKINLSLSELTRFFRRLAEQIKHKKFVPGHDLPGCNAYFLGRYLKKTILQARTYLIAAVRPEVKFQSYTYSTLEFAHNASVVELAPKKPKVTKSDHESENILREMEKLKKELENANNENAHLRGGEAELEKKKNELAMKVKKLEEDLKEEQEEDISSQQELQHQADMYHSRGILMAGFDDELECPYLENLDVDDFRNKRLYFPLRKEVTVIGRHADVRPLTFSVTNKHCTFRKNGNKILLVGGLGKTYHNGSKINVNEEVEVKPFDRIVMGDLMTMLRWHNNEEKTIVPMTAEAAFAEFHPIESASKRTRMRHASSKNIVASTLSADITKRMTELTPGIEEVNGLFKLFNRAMLKCELAMRFEFDNKSIDSTPTPVLRVEIHRTDLKDVIPVVMETFIFVKIHELLKQELGHLHTALHRKVDYIVPTNHRPFDLIYDTEFTVGSASMPLSALWTVGKDKVLQADSTSSIIRGSLPPNESVGQLKYQWEVIAHPVLGSSETIGNVSSSSMIESDMIGSEWRFKLVIEAATDLAVNFASVYCQYAFYGQVFTTEVVQSTTELERGLNFKYSCTHGIDTTTSQFLEYMEQDIFEIKFVGKVRPQHVPDDEIGTTNKIIATNIKNIFAIVDGLADGDSPLTDSERERAIQEIETHRNLSNSIKATTVKALETCKTVHQKRDIMNSARFGGSEEDINEIAKRNLTRRSSQKSLNRVRTLVKMVGKFRKEEHEKELEELLQKRANDLDLAQQETQAVNERYKNTALVVAGFYHITSAERDEAIAEIQMAQNSMKKDVYSATEEALLQASTKFEVDAILGEAILSNTTAEDIRRIAKRSRKDGYQVEDSELKKLKADIQSNYDLSSEQRDAAFHGLSLCSVSRQFEELRDSILHRLSAESIAESCLLLSERNTSKHALRGELHRSRESFAREQKSVTKTMKERQAFESKLRQSEENLRKSNREWEKKLNMEETRSDDMNRKLLKAQAQEDQTKNQLAALQKTIQSQNMSLDEHSVELGKEAKAMNKRLNELIGTFTSINGDLSVDFRKVRSAMDTLGSNADANRRTKKELKVKGEQLAASQTQVDIANTKVRNLEEKMQLLDADLEDARKKVKQGAANFTDLESELANSSNLVEQLRIEIKNNNMTISTLKSQQAISAKNISRQKNDFEQQANVLETLQQKFQALQISKAENEQKYSEQIRQIKFQNDESAEQLLLVQEELEHETARHKKQTTAANRAFDLKLDNQKRAHERMFQNKVSDLEQSLKQTESIKSKLQQSLKLVRNELMQVEDKMSTLESENNEVKTKLSQLEYQCNKLTNQNNELSEFDTKQKEKIIELESIESQLNRKISELISKINAQSQEIESQKNELESVAAEAFEQQVKDLQLKLNALASASKQSNIEYEGIIKQLNEDHKREIDTVTLALNKDVENKVKEMKKAEENHRSAMEAAIITSNNDVDKKTKELQLKVTSLQSEREKIEADCSRQLEIMQDKLDKDEKRHKINIKNIHSDYERDVEDKTKRMIKLEEKLNELTRKYKKDLGESNTRLIEFEVKYNDAKRDSESSAQRIEPMEEQISKQIREIARLKDMASASGGTIGELEGKLEVSKQQLASISTKYETQRREADRSRNSLRESQAQVSELRTEVSALKSQVQEIPVHEAEVDRLRRKIEEGSSHQNAVIRELQARAHEAENRAQRAEEKIVEETTKIKMECSRLKQELANNEKQVEAIQSDVESRLRDQDEMHSRSLDDLSAKNRRLQSEKESISRTMEQMRSDHHTQIMELQDRLTTEAEQYFLQGKEQADTEINSLKRKLEKNQREAEEQAYRQEQSWLTERSYMRKELDTARGAAQHAQKALQKLMLDMERQVISTDKIKGELRASKQALADTNASLLEMRKISTVAEAEKIKVQRLEGELRASESVNAHAQHLEQQLRDTERALQEAVAQKLEVETQLGSLVNSSRVDQLREKVGRLRDAVSGDKSDNGTNFSYNNDNGLTNHSERGILDALSIDHSRALSANGELRRELSREQDAAAAANKRLYEEREAASSKIKQLTTILRQAQESWDREREDILDSRRKAEVAKHEFESAAKLYSRLSKDATQERDNALRSFEEQSQVLQKKRAELQEARSTILNLRDENINLSHQTDLLRTEVSKITNVTTRKRKIKYDLQNELSMASGELGSTGIDSLGIRNNGIRNKTTNYEKGFLGVREADEEVNAMRNFFGVERSSRLKDESEKVAWDVRKRSVGEV